MIKVVIGFDDAETVAYHVLSQSILKRSSVPVSIVPLRKSHLSGFFTRERGQYDSTDFSITRFLVPFLCDFQGYSIFLDCDQLVLTDIADLWAASVFDWRNADNIALHVVKHSYQPVETTKFLGQTQTKYQYKNWSSVMLFNNKLCRNLTPDYVSKAPGLDLHQFQWLNPNQIAGLPKQWNWLVGEPGYEEVPADVKLLHYTKGTPCFDEYKDCPEAGRWWQEYQDMNSPVPL